MLTIWGRADSSNVQAVMWCVGELGLPHDRIDVGHRFGGTDTREFVAMNPMRTIPVIQDGGDPPLWETGAILRFLAGRYGSDSFWPADPVSRADVDRWAEWAKLNVVAGFAGPIFMRLIRTPEPERDMVAIYRAKDALDRILGIADARLERHEFLVGRDFTLADIQFGHILWRYFALDLPRSDLPNLRRYFDTLADRPAYGTHVAVSFDALRV